MHAPLLPTLVGAAACAFGPVTIALAGTPSTPNDDVADAASHARMVRVLRELATEAASKNPYLSSAELLERRAATTDGTLPTDPVRKVWAYVNLGRLELRAGEPDRAVAWLERAQTALAESSQPYPRLELQVLYDLALAHLRLGENANCVARHTAESCILPITGSGVHKVQMGSRTAMRLLKEILGNPRTDDSMRLASRWLLSIAAMTVGEYPDGIDADLRIPPEAFESEVAFPRFTDVAPKLGVNTFDLGGGAVVADFDGDEIPDLLSSTWDSSGELALQIGDGKGGYALRTAEAGLTGILGGLNLVQADYDGDGDVDVLVLRGAWLGAEGCQPNSLLRNEGDGTFVDVAFSSGIGEDPRPTQTGAWADYDLDGDLDLYVGNESSGLARYPSQLFRNDRGRFVDVAAEAGVSNMRMAKGVSWGDYDDDGDPDLYVSNLGGWNRLYRNDGDGTFTDVAPDAKLLGPYDSFATWFWDYDNDGDLDLYVASYHQKGSASNHDAFRLIPTVAGYLGVEHPAERAALYENDGEGNFHDVALERGLDRVSLTMGANFGDLDNDGFLDFYLGTGYPYFDGLVPNVMYRNRGGRTFEDVTTAGGFGHVQKGHGIVFADVDGDGDQDVFEQMGGAYPGDAFGNVLYENPGTTNHWVGIRLTGRRSNSLGIGARVTVTVTDTKGDQHTFHRTVGETGSFGSNPLQLHVGLGDAERIDRIDVRWPITDSVQSFEDAPLDRILAIEEGNPDLAATRPRTFTLGG